MFVVDGVDGGCVDVGVVVLAVVVFVGGGFKLFFLLLQ